MKLDQLKKGLWGYKKASVYEYITMMEEEFSEKLAEKVTEQKKQEEEYRTQITSLEEELSRVRKELEEQKKEQMNVAAALMEAVRYKDELRQEAQEKMQEERAAWEKKLEEGAKELNGYQKQIAKVREMIQGLLQSMDAKSEEVEMQIQTVKAACPRHNMTLFERNHTEEA